MGFGKFLLCAAGGIAAVVAAPVVLPAAAAAGAIAVGTAGTAIAGAGAAVAGAGAAAAGAATAAVGAVGTAVAGTAVGGAATAAMGAVGTAVGTAASVAVAAPVIGGAASTVAAIAGGTTAGAVGVGTIATTGAIGVANAAKGVSKLSDASSIKESAMENYNEKKDQFDSVQSDTSNALQSLGKRKIEIWDSFNRFIAAYSKIQNPPILQGSAGVESLELSVDDLKNIKAVAISARNLVKGGIGTIAVGDLIGLATSGGLVSTVTVASTGTAITSLSGAAATNATMAALGGGSLAAEGAGMAGGAAVLSGLTIAPMLMVGGILLNSKASSALEQAEEIQRQSNRAVRKMDESIIELNKIHRLCDAALDELNNLYGLYLSYVGKLEIIVARKPDYSEFSFDEKKILEKCVLAIKTLKVLTQQKIVDDNSRALEQQVNDALAASVSKRKAIDSKNGNEYA